MTAVRRLVRVPPHRTPERRAIVMNQAPGTYSKGTMRVLAVAGTLLGAAVLAGGIVKTGQGDGQGPALLMVGVAVLLVLAVLVPLAIRRGRL